MKIDSHFAVPPIRVGRRKLLTKEQLSANAVARMKQWRIDNPDANKNQRLKLYGITFEQYQTKLREQNYCCAACGDKLDLMKNTHQDHKGSKARGVLCHWCNLAVGQLKDSIERAEKIVAYLRKWS